MFERFMTQMRENKVGGPIIILGIGAFFVCHANGFLRSYIPDDSFWWTKYGRLAASFVIAAFGMLCELLYRMIRKLLSGENGSGQKSEPAPSSDRIRL